MPEGDLPTPTLSNERLVIHARNGNESPDETFWVANAKWGDGANAELGVVIVARRHPSLIDLKLSLIGYRYAKPDPPGPQPSPIPRTPTLVRKPGRHILIVEFPPQHIAERIERDVGDDEVHSPAPARLSGPSRLVFEIPRVAEWNPVMLELAALTDWSRLTPLVHPRAAGGIGTEVDRQLAAVFGSASGGDALTFEAVTAKIAEKLLAPAATETALELAGRLLFSPSEGGRWLRSEVGPAEWATGSGAQRASAPLGTVRLNDSGSKSVRAIWSTQFKEGGFPAGLAAKDKDHSGPVTTEHPNGTPMLSLAPLDHWEIVGQTSVYALPALRRIEREGTGAIPAGQGPAGLEASPKGNVIRPDRDILYLRQIDCAEGFTERDTGIAIATPFRDANVSLSTLGGIVTAEWKGEPARLLPRALATFPGEDKCGPGCAKRRPWEGFSLERLFQQGWLGRDSRVVAVYKGFLFPLGIRASYTIVHERQIHIDRTRGPVSFLVRREFIVSPPRRRPYPGPYHPFDARGFPVAGIRMKTLVTPDLVCEDVSQPAIEPGNIFWPRVRQQDGSIADFQFEWATDDVESVKSPLIFVRNDALSLPKAMDDLVRAYLREGTRRTASFGGARQRYGVALKAGDTSYDTDSWLLGVSGRTDGSDDIDERFRIDGRMEGADQPPFYPFVDKATVGIQSVDRLLGTPQGRYDILFDEDYLKRGFEGPDIYLRLAGAGAAMDATKKTEATGGLSNQNVQIGGLSRLTGPVGGTKTTTLTGDAVVDISAAKQGQFDPASFFGNLNLLGILNLAKMLPKTTNFANDAPHLLETFDFGVEEAGLARLRAAAREARRGFHETGLDQRPLEWIRDPLPGTDLKVVELYPVLVRAIRDLVAGLKAQLLAIEGLPDSGGVGGVISHAKAILDLAQPAIRELERILGDPVPEQLKLIFERLRAVPKAMLDEVRNQLTGLARALAEAAKTWFKDAFCTAVEQQQLGGVLFGKPLTCADLANPAAALDRVADSLLAKAIAEPVAELISALLLWLEPAKALLALRGTQAEALIVARLQEAVEIVAARLKAPVSGDDADIRDPRRQQQFVEAIRGDLDRLLTPSEVTIEAVAAHAKTRKVALEAWVAAGLREQVDRLKTALRPIDAGELDALFEAVRNSLLGDLERALVHPLIAKVEIFKSAVAMVAEAVATGAAAHGLLAYLVDLAAKATDLIDKAGTFAAICAKRTQTCQYLNSAAKALTEGLTGPIGDARNQIDLLIAAARGIAPSGTNASAIAKARAAVILEAEALKARLYAFPNAGAFDFCADASEASILQVQAYADLRREAVAALGRIAGMARDLEGWLGASDAAVKKIVENSAKLYLGAAGVALTGVGQNWSGTIRTALDTVGALIEPIRADYTADLVAGFNEAKRAADQMRSLLSDTSLTAETLHQAAVKGNGLVAALDRSLTGPLLQSVALSEALTATVGTAASKLVKSFALTAAKPLLLVYDALADAFQKLHELVPDQSLTDKLLRFAMGMTSGSPSQQFAAIESKLRAEAATIRGLETLSAPDALEAIRTLAKKFRDKDDALHAAVPAINALAMVNFGQSFIAGIREELDRLLEQLQGLVRQFVPTAVTTSYEWGTQVPPFPNATDPIFQMTGAPRFDLTVDDVVIGDYLKFVQALQQWLSPAGSGLYVKPIFGPPGIEVGYVYDAGIIQVGTLQFINVAFKIAARLYFGGKKAEFSFALGSPKYPVLVANPPYGGGGWIELTCDAKGVTGMDVSIVFGGVAALKFGPLNAQGRVVAGIQVTTKDVEDVGPEPHDTRKAMTFVAIFEAVGEGSIA